MSWDCQSHPAQSAIGSKFNPLNLAISNKSILFPKERVHISEYRNTEYKCVNGMFVHVNSNEKKAGVAFIISDQVNF